MSEENAKCFFDAVPDMIRDIEQFILFFEKAYTSDDLSDLKDFMGVFEGYREYEKKANHSVKMYYKEMKKYIDKVAFFKHCLALKGVENYIFTNKAIKTMKNSIKSADIYEKKSNKLFKLFIELETQFKICEVYINLIYKKNKIDTLSTNSDYSFITFKKEVEQ